MTFSRGLLIALVAVILVIAAAAWYLLGPNGVAAAKLVPGDSLAFAFIPNGAGLGASYSTSQIRKLVEAPETQPLIDQLQHLIGDKNLGLLKLLLPDLSGQSFLAITHLDPEHPGETGFVAGMHPKLGSDNFDTFVQQVNAAYPDMAKETKTGHDTLLGVDYQWIQGNNAPGRICVARYHGWIVTTWGEASLQDWLERVQGKSATPSLADNADYQKSLQRVGADAQSVLYVDYPRALGLWIAHLEKTNPALAESMKKRVASLGAAAVGTRFDHGEISDHFSLLENKQAQQDSGIAATPCPFETLKFTGPDTRFYFAANVNWPQAWKNIQEQANGGQPGAHPMLDQLQAWAQSENIDVEKNIIDALGSECSFQIEWASDALYPNVGVYFKVDKPDDFKPAIAALIDATRKEFATSAVITEMNSNNQNFATLKLIRPMPISPTVTEDGPYFGLFLDETHAVRSMARDESLGLLNNADFKRQIGDQRNGASELVFLDGPRLFDQAYRTALPFVSMGAMLNPTIASVIKGRQLPPDLAWLAPMGTWAATAKCDEDGIIATSLSGVGNQGVLLAGGLGAGVMVLQSAGIIPQGHFTTAVPGNPNAPAPAPANTPAPPAAPLAPATLPAPPAPASDATSTPPPAPADSTH